MAAENGSQKFIARNRAPRVQIEYDVECYGSDRSVQLPFVMAVMADLSGKSTSTRDPVEEKTFLGIDIDNFDDRLKAKRPLLQIEVDNTLTGEGKLFVKMVFESIEDFSPAAVARKVEPLRKLLEARTRLSDLQTYVDGKAAAERLIHRLLRDTSLLLALARDKRDDAGTVTPSG